MILEAETLIKYGYLSSELKPQSNKCILAACAECGKVRETSKNGYRAICKSCAHKSEKNPFFGKKHTKETKALISKNHADFSGEKSSCFLGGKKISKSIAQAKRKRQLGYILLLPLEEGEVGHHMTDEYVIGIPEDVHIRFSGYGRKKHRALILKWLKNNDMKKYELVFYILATE